MPIEFRCTQCQKLLRTGDDTAGKQAKCPECGTQLTVPSTHGRVANAPASLETGNPYQASYGAASHEYESGRLDTASRGARLLGALIDVALVAAFGIPVVIWQFSSLVGNQDLMAQLRLQGWIFAASLPLMIVQWYLISTSGQSLGKKLVGTRIVDNETGANPGFLRAVALRSWVVSLIASVPCIGGLFGLVDTLWIFGEQSRCLHDLMANTRVVKA